MFFRDVIGQEEIKQRLIQEVNEGRIPHAQLICVYSYTFDFGCEITI